MVEINRKCGICIRGVSDACTNELLQAAFERFGTVTDTYVKAQRNYAFVTFAEQSSVALAISDAPSVIGGDDVTVEERRPLRAAPLTTNNNVYIKGFPEDTSEDMVRDAVASFGAPTSLRVKAAFGFAFVGFASVEEASAVVNAAPLTVNGAATTVEFRLSKVRSEKKPRGEGGEGGGASERKGGDAPRKRKPRVRKPKKIAPNSVWLKGVPEDATDEDITDALSSFGTVVSVDHQNGRDFAFAVFETPESMGGAVSSSGSVSIAGNTIVVQERTGKRPVGQEAAEGV